jgi:RNA polymerase sigma-70 factor (ECF subfamily)
MAEHPGHLSDEDLVERVAARDRDAFLALYDRFSPRMLGLILSIMRHRSAAEDVLQDAMLEVWTRHAARYKPTLGSVESWMLRLARARAIDHLRSSFRRTGSAPETAGASLEWIDSGSARHDAAALRAALLDLPIDQREPLVLAFAHGLTREQIASHLGIPVGTVKTRVRLGVHRLRERLADGTGACQ